MGRAGDKPQLPPAGLQRGQAEALPAKKTSPGLAFPGDEVLPCPSPTSQRVPMALPRCRGCLCHLRLCPADRCAQSPSASPSAQLLPGDARKSREEGKTKGKADGNRQSPAGAAGASGEAAPGSVPAALHQPPSLPHRTGTAKAAQRGFLIPERCRDHPAPSRRSAPSFGAGKSPKPS